VLTARVLVFLMGGSVGLFGLYGLLEAFVVYEVAADSITRRAWNGQRMMRWSEVARVDVSGQRDSELVLSDGLGQKPSLQRGLMSQKHVMAFNTLLEPYLAPVRERQLRDVGSLNSVYYPKRGTTWAGVTMLVIVGFIMLFFFSMMPVPSDEWWVVAILMGFIVVGGLFFLWLTISAYTTALTVTNYDLKESSAFKTRQISFQRVTSLMSRTVTVKNGSFELTTIEGAGQKISITSQMKDYALQVTYIRQHVDSKAQSRGEVKAQEMNTKEQKQQRVFLPIFALINFVLLGGFGINEIKDGNTRLADYRLLQTQGQQAQGRILSTNTKGSKSVTYLIKYAFEDTEGRTLVRSSPVSHDDYSTARISAPVQVTYIPGSDHISMIAQSIGKRKAEGDVRTGYFFIGFACLLTPLIALTPYMKRKKQTV
jgi:hypothetical protein